MLQARLLSRTMAELVRMCRAPYVKQAIRHQAPPEPSALPA